MGLCSDGDIMKRLGNSLELSRFIFADVDSSVEMGAAACIMRMLLKDQLVDWLRNGCIFCSSEKPLLVLRHGASESEAYPAAAGRESRWVF
jgi:hypothetical protein